MSIDIDLQVRKRLRRRRLLLGLSQRQVAEMTGIRFTQIQKYECGKNRVSLEKLLQLSEALKVPVIHFFEGVDDGTTQADMLDQKVLESLFEKEVIELLQIYRRISKKDERHRVLVFAKAMALNPVEDLC